MSVGDVHDIMEAFFADGGEVFRLFDLLLVDYEVHEYFVFVSAHELGFVDRVDWMEREVPIEYTFLREADTLAYDSCILYYIFPH